MNISSGTERHSNKFNGCKKFSPIKFFNLDRNELGQKILINLFLFFNFFYHVFLDITRTTNCFSSGFFQAVGTQLWLKNNNSIYMYRYILPLLPREKGGTTTVTYETIPVIFVMQRIRSPAPADCVITSGSF